MLNVAVPEPLASAAAVFFGRHGEVIRHALRRAVSRQRLYREARRAALAELDAVARPLVTQAAADEIFIGSQTEMTRACVG